MIFVYLIICGILTYGDLLFRIIPDKMIIIGIIIAFLGNLKSPLGPLGTIEGMIAGGLSIFIAGMLCFLISKKPALGGGDLKLLAMIGAFWGWQVALTTFAIAPIMGSLWAGILNRTKLPYGIFLIGASLIALIIWRYYGS